MSGASQAFRLPKAGNSDADYEDAFAMAKDSVAIADGATESSFARAWARALVQGFTSIDAADAESEAGDEALREPPAPADTVRRRIAPLQRAWHEQIAWDRLPWFAEDKARSGAFAALLTFRFTASASPLMPSAEDAALGSGRWRALAIGDSCMFQIRDDALLVAFPLEQAEQFNSRPVLLSSNPANNDRVWEAIAYQEGEYRPADVFLFATDALAHWILAESEAGNRPWQTLCGLRSHADFAAMVARLRQDHAMRNDDVTLVRIVVPFGAVSPPDSESPAALVEQSDLVTYPDMGGSAADCEAGSDESVPPNGADGVPGQMQYSVGRPESPEESIPVGSFANETESMHVDEVLSRTEGAP